MKIFFTVFLASLLIMGCSVSAKEIEIASYEVVKEEVNQDIEIRRYDPVILVETSMQGDNRNGAFRRLFKYITGENVKQSEIPMTAPVFIDKESEIIDQGQEIPMTAPVFMDDKSDQDSMMSFVLPASYTMETAPIPTNKEVTLRELKDYTVAVIRFNGTLGDTNVEKHKTKLMHWIEDNQYKITGEYRVAGYNAPFTLPWLRRNEVLIPIDLP